MKVLVQIEVKAAVSFTVDLCTCIWPFLCMNKTQIWCTHLPYHTFLLEARNPNWQLHAK